MTNIAKSTKSNDTQIPPNPVRNTNCTKCRQTIYESHLLLADQRLWHEDCLRCICCDARLAELDKIFYMKAQMPLCRRDYLRLYGRTGDCEVCRKRVQAFEFVMKVHGRNYHLNCFCCQRCQLRFCVGDRFYVFNNQILCEYDYTEVALSVKPLNKDESMIPALVDQKKFICSNDTSSHLTQLPSKSNPMPMTSQAFSLSRTLQSNPGQEGKPPESPNSSPIVLTTDDHSSGYGSPSSPSHILL